MRIVLDLQACQATHHDRDIGRTSLNFARTVARLANSAGRHHDVRILLNHAFPASVDLLKHELRDVIAPEQFTVFDSPEGIAAVNAPNPWRSRAAECLRAHALAMLNPDIVHLSHLFDGWADNAVASIGHTPSSGASTASLHDLAPFKMADAHLSDPPVRDWHFQKLKGLKRADLLLAASALTRTDAIDTLGIEPDRIIDISFAADQQFAVRPVHDAVRLRAKYQISREFVLCTGGADAQQNTAGLIEAFARLPVALLRQHQLAIVCTGNADERAALLALAKRHGLAQSSVVIIGEVSESDLVDLYNLATLFILPLRGEGFVLPLLQAMACGTPVLGSNSTSAPEVIGRDDVLFDADSASSMTAAMVKVLGSPSMRQELSENGLMRAATFTWESCATKALDGFEALHDRRTHALTASGAVLQTPSTARRPRLAWVSPLPPAKSGIADYSAEILRELDCFYDVETVAPAESDDAWVLANGPVRSPEWFRTHAHQFDRVVYHFGNSAHHTHMYRLLAEIPGVVVLHDFYLGDMVNHLDQTTQHNAFARALYLSHGYPALVALGKDGRAAACWQYPANGEVLENADGVIVHSSFSRTLAEQWYSPAMARTWRTIPHLRTVANVDRAAARRRLKLDDSTYVVCAFGMLGPSKLNHVLLEAWLKSPLAADKKCLLVFVGENDQGRYGLEIKRRIAASACAARIVITGFAPRGLYQDYLHAADCGVQLRGI